METVISCITPTFNRAHLLPRAIESTNNQTYPHWEMIIVDDGSEDNTQEVVRDYMQKDARIKYFKNPGKGGNAARNHGIRQSKGEWIAFLDDDVENLPDRFELQLDAMRKSGSGFILSGFISAGHNGKETFINEGLWGQGAGITSRWFIKKDLLNKAGLFDEKMPAMQECELSYRIAQFESFANHFDLVTREYQSANSVSTGLNGIKGAEMLIEKHSDKMDAGELAWWHYKVGIGYLNLGANLSKTKASFKEAAKLTGCVWYKLIYYYTFLFGLINIGPFKRINGKIVSKLQSLVKVEKRDHLVIGKNQSIT